MWRRLDAVSTFATTSSSCFAAIALIAACAILSYSVLSRSLFHSANYWQDEAAVFLLVGATFMTSAYRSRPARPYRHRSVRRTAVAASQSDPALAGRCRELCCSAHSSPGNPGRWRMKHGSTARFQTRCGRRRSRFPMCLMALGMTLLCVQILLQIVSSVEPADASMTVLGIGISYGIATLVAMFSGMPIAFALGAVAVVFMAIYMPGARSIPSRRMSMRKWPRSRCCRSRCSS